MRSVLGFILYTIMCLLLAANLFLAGHSAGFTMGYHVGYIDKDLGYPEGYSLEVK